LVPVSGVCRSHGVNRRHVLSLLFLSLFYVLAVGYPAAMLVLESLRADGAFAIANYVRLLNFANVANREAVTNSVLMSLASVVTSGVVGTLLAVTLTQVRPRGTSVMSRLAVIPIALPPLVGTIAFLFVFGATGVLPRLWGALLGGKGAPFALDGMTGVVAVHTYSFNVYSYLLVSTALEKIDRSQLEAARLMGSSSWRTFLRVILPELRPALVGAGMLTFMASMASFTAPLLFAGDQRYLTVEIYNTKVNGDLNLAAAQSFLLALISIAFYSVAVRATLSDWQAARTKGSAEQGRIQLGRYAGNALSIVTFGILLLEILPLLAIVVMSFAREGSWTWQVFPSSFSVDNYVKMFSEASMLQPIMNSLLMTVLAVVAALAIGISAAIFLSKGGVRRGRIVSEVALSLPYAIPGTVIAIGLILAFNRSLPGGPVLVGTFWIVPLAYVIRTYPLVVRSTAASLDQIDDSLLEAAEGLGAGKWRQFREVILPLTVSGIVSGATLAAIACLGEFVSSILLYTYSSRPIAVEIFSQLRSFSLGTAASYAVFLLVITGALLWIAGKWGGESSRHTSGMDT
jgi:iron(III) transport system permease protein